MKRIFATLAIAAAVLMTSTMVFAQDPPAQDHERGRGGPGGFRGGPGGFGMRDLNLTTDQKTQIDNFHKAERTQMEALDKQALTREQYRTQAMQIHQQTQTQVEGVLTADQKAKMEAARKAHGPGGPGGPQGHRPPPPQSN